MRNEVVHSGGFDLYLQLRRPMKALNKDSTLACCFVLGPHPALLKAMSLGLTPGRIRGLSGLLGITLGSAPGKLLEQGLTQG